MKQYARNKWLWAFFGLSILVVNPAWADKPEWAGNKHERQKEYKQDRREDAGRGGQGNKPEKQGRHFSDHHRKIAADHYGNYYHNKKRCPPGLARKHNGCMPPGQARQWEMHRPLPHDVKYYYVPNSVVVQMGPPPHGHRYVRVGADILLIAVGTHMVVDAITDIAR